MNENINIVEILKNAPKGTKLYSSVCGGCQLYSIYNNIIRCKIEGSYVIFDNKGRFSNFEGECVLFPSKDNRDWSTFKVLKKHKEFEPFQKVLCVADNNHDCEVWSADFYSHYDKSTFEHYLVSGFVKADDEVIPYEGNEDKLGKPVEYNKLWKQIK